MKNRHARIGIEDHGGENDRCRAMLILPFHSLAGASLGRAESRIRGKVPVPRRASTHTNGNMCANVHPHPYSLAKVRAGG